MWVGDSAYRKPEKIPLFFQRLREMGVNTAMAYGDAELGPLLENKFPYYVENLINRGLCLKFNSKVRDWDRFVTDWARQGRPESALIRDYCLDDPEWRNWARHQMQRLAAKNRDHTPLAYNIRDELSTTISANPFDYDFNPLALGGFRDWLKTQYRDLAALNAEWDTPFSDWEQVRPFTTDEIKNRMASGEPLPHGKPDWQALQAVRFDPATAASSPARWNFSPWTDFRSYMDLSLARTLDDLRRAAHEVDPHTPVGIEGTQMPHAFGGYDLARLAQVLDWVEPNDIGNAREIFGSFMPDRPLLTTVFEKETNPARRRLWHLLLEGDRGCIVWWSEDSIDWNSTDYRLTAKALALAPVLKEMTSPLACLFLHAKPIYDPIWILYSQPSVQVDWLLESTVDGSTWLRRFSSFEAEHNVMAQVRDSWLKVFQDLGYSPRFISSQQVEQGELPEKRPAIVVLPTAWALSDKEAAQIKQFLSHSGPSATTRVAAGQASSPVPANANEGSIFSSPTWLFCDNTPGCFDEHGKLRNRSVLADFSGPALSGATNGFVLRNGQPANISTTSVPLYFLDRLQKNADLRAAEWIAHQLKDMRPEIVVPTSARARIHRFRSGAVQLVAIERNVDYHMSEALAQAGGNEVLETPVDIEATLREPMHVYDLRTQKYLGHVQRIPFRLDPWQPTLLALSEVKVSVESINADKPAAE
jgi:hypothetical protein